MSSNNKREWCKQKPEQQPEQQKGIRALGFEKATPVQAITIPGQQSNKDVCVQAVTGSGKTLSFVQPCQQIQQKIKTLKKNDIGCIILSPTHELAIQIKNVVEHFLPYLSKKLTLSIMIGTKSIKSCINNARENGCNIIIGTPGRIYSVQKDSTISDLNIKTLECLIFDEADRLLELGFQVVINNILSKIPKQRRTGLFSATLYDAVEKQVRTGLRNPIRIVVHDAVSSNIATTNTTTITNNAVGMNSNNTVNVTAENSAVNVNTTNSTVNMNSNNSAVNINNNIKNLSLNNIEYINEENTNRNVNNISNKIPITLKNYYCIVEPEQKLEILVQFQLNNNDKKIIIFFITCACVEYFTKVLSCYKPLKDKYNFKQDIISTSKDTIKPIIISQHGNMLQTRRRNNYEMFVKSTSGIQLCTDLAARGIDIPDIDVIIQFDAPQNPDFYIHRIGRCARAGRPGVAILYILPHELPFIYYLENKLINISRVNYILSNKDIVIKSIYSPLNEIYTHKELLENMTSNNTIDSDSNYCACAMNKNQYKIDDECMSINKQKNFLNEYVLINGKLEWIHRNEQKNKNTIEQKQKELKQKLRIQGKKLTIKYKHEQIENEKKKENELRKKVQQNLQKSQYINLNIILLQEDINVNNISIVNTIRRNIWNDRYLLDLSTNAFTSLVRGYKEHYLRNIFEFKNMPFLQIALGYGLLYMPIVPELKRYNFIFPTLTRKLPRNIEYIDKDMQSKWEIEIKKRSQSNELKKQERLQKEKIRTKKIQFSEKQHAKKNKTKKKRTHEEMVQEWEELAQDIKEIKRSRR